MALKNLLTRNHAFSMENIEIKASLKLVEDDYEISHILDPSTGTYSVKNKLGNKVMEFDNNLSLKSGNALHAHIQSKVQTVADTTDDHEGRIVTLENAITSDPGMGRIDQILEIGNDADGNAIVGLSSVTTDALILNGNDVESDIGDLQNFKEIYEPIINSIENVIVTSTTTDYPRVSIRNIDVSNNTFGYIFGKVIFNNGCIEFKINVNNTDNTITINTVDLDYYNVNVIDVSFEINEINTQILMFLDNLTENIKYKLIYKTELIDL